MILILIAVFFVFSAIFSMMGQGGGVVYTPIQVWAGIDFHEAAATSLFLIAAVSLSSTIVFRKAKKTDWGLAITLESSTMVGGFLGGIVSSWFTAGPLSVLFAVMVFVSSYFMLSPKTQKDHCSEVKRTRLHWRRSLGDRTYCVNLPLALSVSLLVGLFSGLLGVGGGILKVPVMVLLLGIPMDIAVGSSAFMVGMTAVAGLAGHILQGHWDWKTSLILGVVVFAGAQIGSRLTVGIDKLRLKKAFGWFLLVIGSLMVIRLFY
ncbi:sulfite exporter TauE/SafE family protein [bacterium]|nr:sulfite exporter TauE/SafE family protein [bacterium]